MTFPIVLLLALTIVAMVLFAVEIISADVVALGLLLALTLTGLLPPERAFAGFGSDAVIVIPGLLILTGALLRTGVMELAGRYCFLDFVRASVRRSHCCSTSLPSQSCRVSGRCGK